MSSKKVSADAVLARLAQRQLVDQNTHRVVIDIRAGQIPIIYTQSYGDEQLFVELITDLQVTEDPKFPRIAPTGYSTTTTEPTDTKDAEQ